MLARKGLLPVDPEAVQMVLRLDGDLHARVAARAYADSIASENTEFSADIYDRLFRAITEKPGEDWPGERRDAG